MSESLESVFGDTTPDPASDIAVAVMSLKWAQGNDADEHGNRYGQIQEIADPIIATAIAEAEARGRRQGLEWQPIETAPKDGRKALVYRPLAQNSQDQPIATKRLIGGNQHCWETTVPAGAMPCNPTDGSCHVTHWMPLPAPPLATAPAETQKPETGESVR